MRWVFVWYAPVQGYVLAEMVPHLDYCIELFREKLAP